MVLPKHEHRSRGSEGLSPRAIARIDMGWKSTEGPGGWTRADHFFPFDGEECKFSVQLKRDIFYLNFLKEFYPIERN